MKKILKNALALTLITVVLGGILGAVYAITKDPIALQEQKTKEKAYQAVFSDAASFEEMEIEESGLNAAFDEAIAGIGLTQEYVNEVATACDASGSALGYVITVTTKEGYGGDIEFTVGIQNDGTMNGIYFLSIEETAGLGMRANTADFKDQFVGKNVESISYSKTGATADNEIDALSGATITSKAVTNGVNAALAAFRTLQEGGTE